MAMNLKTWAPLAAAIVMGTVAAKMGHDLIGRKPAEKTVEVRVAKVVVAKENVTAGAPLKATDLTVAKVDEKMAPMGALSSPDELVGRVARAPLIKGQPVTEAMLAPRGSAVGLTAIVPEGMRAVTLEINEVSGVAGLLSVGCRVDVVSTFPGENGQMLSKTIVQNLQVIAVGKKYAASGQAAAQQMAKEKDGGGEANEREGAVARNVTLLVTPRQAEVIDLAAHTGAPRLVLRGSNGKDDDVADASGDGITLAELRGAAKESKPTFLTRLTANLTSIAEQIKKEQDEAAMAAASAGKPSLFGQTAVAPATQPTRQVTVIRSTKEENVNLLAPPRQPRGPVMADTKEPADDE